MKMKTKMSTKKQKDGTYEVNWEGIEIHLVAENGFRHIFICDKSMTSGRWLSKYFHASMDWKPKTVMVSAMLPFSTRSEAVVNRSGQTQFEITDFDEGDEIGTAGEGI